MGRIALSPGPMRDRRIRIRSAETKRWRTYDVDEDLDPDVLQRINDLAFVHGVQVVSTCAGHPEGRYGHPTLDRPLGFADVRFGVFYPSVMPLDAQRARICIELVAKAIVGESTSVAISHELVIRDTTWDPREQRFGRSLLIARHDRPTAEGPAAAKMWWQAIAERLARAVDSLPDPRRERPLCAEIRVLPGEN